MNNSDTKIPNATSLIHINQYNTDTQNLEKKIPHTSSLETVHNTKIGEVENKISDHAKDITTQEFNKLTAEHFAARLKQADLLSKNDSDNKQISFNKRITSN